MSLPFYKILKRISDIVLSFLALICLSPLFVLIAIPIHINSRGDIFYTQNRVGWKMKIFRLIKFRTMFVDADKQGEITIGRNDPRVTKVGFMLRKYKLDELPQLINILKGEMSFVGPRPEVKRYVQLFPEDYKTILSVRPGLTDFATILFFNENRLLSSHSDPEQYYIERIIPRKLYLAKKYIQKQGFCNDIYILFRTVKKMFR